MTRRCPSSIATPVVVSSTIVHILLSIRHLVSTCPNNLTKGGLLGLPRFLSLTHPRTFPPLPSATLKHKKKGCPVLSGARTLAANKQNNLLRTCSSATICRNPLPLSCNVQWLFCSPQDADRPQGRRRRGNKQESCSKEAVQVSFISPNGERHVRSRLSTSCRHGPSGKSSKLFSFRLDYMTSWLVVVELWSPSWLIQPTNSYYICTKHQ